MRLGSGPMMHSLSGTRSTVTADHCCPIRDMHVQLLVKPLLLTFLTSTVVTSQCFFARSTAKVRRREESLSCSQSTSFGSACCWDRVRKRHKTRSRSFLLLSRRLAASGSDVSLTSSPSVPTCYLRPPLPRLPLATCSPVPRQRTSRQLSPHLHLHDHSVACRE